MKVALVQWIIIALLTAATTAAVIDAGRARTTQESERIARITDEALSVTPFSTSMVIHDVNPSTQQFVLGFFNTRLGVEALFLATAVPQTILESYEPVIDDGVITGFNSRKELTIEEIPVGSSGVANLYYDKNGVLHIRRITVGVGSWDR